MTDSRVEQLDRKLGSYAVFFISVIGVWLLVGPLAPEWSGYAWMSRTLGGDTQVLRFFVAFLFLYFAGIVREKNSLRQTLHGMMKVLKGHLPTSQPGHVKDAIDILIHSVASDRADLRTKVLAQLKELTGQDLGSDPGAWKAWWAEHRHSFQPPRR